MTVGYTFGEYDAVVVFEAPDDTAAARLALVVAGSGATKAGKTTRLLSGQEWIESLQQAHGSFAPAAAVARRPVPRLDPPTASSAGVSRLATYLWPVSEPIVLGRQARARHPVAGMLRGQRSSEPTRVPA